MTTVPPANTTAWPAVATARPTASGTVSPGSQVLAVPGDQEQRVVDAHAEADHGCHDRRPDGDVDDVGDQRQGARADRRAPNSPIAVGSPAAIRDPKATSRITSAATRPTTSPTLDRGLLEGEVEVAAGSICSGRPERASSRAVLSRARSLASSLLDGGVLHAHQRDPTVRRHHLGVHGSLLVRGEHPRRVRGADHVREPGQRLLQVGQVGPGSGGLEEGGAGGSRRRDDVRREPLGSRVGARQQLGRGLRVDSPATSSCRRGRARLSQRRP